MINPEQLKNAAAASGAIYPESVKTSADAYYRCKYRTPCGLCSLKSIEGGLPVKCLRNGDAK